MQDRTIDNALLALRKRIIREGGEGLDHVEALLAMRGVGMPRIFALKDKPFASREVRRAILKALSDGSKSGPDIYRAVMQLRDGMDYQTAQGRVSNVLTKMRQEGLVQRRDRKWLGGESGIC